MANSNTPRNSSTMAKLLLQNKPLPNHHQLSTSAASFRLVAAPAVSSSSLPNPSGNKATPNRSTIIVSPLATSSTTSAANPNEIPTLVVQQASPSPINMSTPATSNNLVVAQPVLIRFSEQQLADMSLKELNHYLRGLSKEEATEVKRLRRAAKNKSYAVVQRERRMDDVQRLSARKAIINEEISAAKFRKTRVADELARVRKEANNLMSLAKRLKIQVPPHIYELRSNNSTTETATSSTQNKATAQ